MTEITVTGAAERRLPANEAELAVDASASGPSRDEVLTRASEAHARLVARAKALVAESIATGYAADPLSTYSNSWRDERGRNIVEHQARASVRIVLRALDRVGELAAEFAEGGADARVSWMLDAETRRAVTRELRAEAVADARAAAEDYARALGAASVTVVRIQDGAEGRYVPLGAARFAMAEAAAPEVTVGEITVSVSVQGTFTTSAPPIVSEA